jgi:hypothetical protein
MRGGRTLCGTSSPGGAGRGVRLRLFRKQSTRAWREFADRDELRLLRSRSAPGLHSEATSDRHTPDRAFLRVSLRARSRGKENRAP